MTGQLLMSNKDINRMNILERLKHKEITQLDASRQMKVSDRQVRRIMAEYMVLGPPALLHKGRGKPSNRRVQEDEVTAAITTLEKPLYVGFAPTFAWEQLTKDHIITFGVDTLRHEMTKHGLWMPKKMKKLVIHQLRERMPHFGDMIQLDGSPHDWFEGRIDPVTGIPVGECTMLLAIDDATGKIKYHFSKEETTLGYFSLMKRYLLEEGKPRKLYSDKHAVFTINRHELKSLDNCLPDSVFDQSLMMTQFGRAMKTLEIESILANSPQAKGRAEKANQTLQDRLVKAMRLNNICSIEAANVFALQYEQVFNAQFSVVPKSQTNTHLPLTKTERDNLDTILAIHSTRILSKNLTCQVDGLIYQIEPVKQNTGYGLRRAKVTIIQTMTGETVVEYQGKHLNYKTYKAPLRQTIRNSKQLHLEAMDLAQQTNQLDNSQSKHKPTYWEQWAENGWNTYDSRYQLP